MSVTTQKEIELYKFSECTFDWRSDRCNKSFKEAGSAAFTSRVNEVVSAAARCFRYTEKRLGESIGLVEASGKGTQRQFVEAVKLAMSFDRRVNYSLAREEILALVQRRVVRLAMDRADRIGLADETEKLVKASFADLLRLTEAREAQLCCLQGERVSLSERRGMAVDAVREEQLSVDDAALKEALASYQEAFGAAERMLRQAAYDRKAAARIGLADQTGKRAAKTCRRQLRLQGLAAKGMQTPKREAFSMREAFNRNLVFRRDVKAALRLAEKVFKRYAMHTIEALAVRAAFLRACNAVLSNIGVAAGEMSLEAFMEAVDRPAKYDRFCDFNVGEYEYQKALVRFILVSMAAQAEPVLYDLTVHVDIDDTNDRGIATIADTSAPTKVHFNKFYYHPPEVNVTLKGGNTADGWIVPCLIRTDGEDEYGRYFEVELRSSGQRVTGTVSWTAKGY